MKAWCVKINGDLHAHSCTSIESTAQSAANFYSGTVVPVEITEIVEDKVESKEPDKAAMIDSLAQWFSDYPLGLVSRMDFKQLVAKHTPREKTAEEKLAEVRKAVEQRLNGTTWESARSDLKAILDLCK